MSSIAAEMGRMSTRVRLRIERVRNLVFDLRHGTDTHAEASLASQGVPLQDTERGRGIYRPFWEPDFHHFVRTLDVDPASYTFVDYGSGKGKLLLLAADYPFAEIIGVEYAPALHDIAVKNVAAYGSRTQKCTAIRCVHADAMAWTPPSVPSIYFIGNAFDAATTRVVVGNIERSLPSQGVPSFLVYASIRSLTDTAAAFSGMTRFRPVAEQKRCLVFKSG